MDQDSSIEVTRKRIGNTWRKGIEDIITPLNFTYAQN